jgi:uncharacterized RDD family membrane protein YckC
MEVAPPPAADPNAIGLYATWWKRFGAWLIDGVLLWGAFALLGAARVAGPGSVSLFLLAPLYLTLCHGSERGQTLGKRAFGIAVRDATSIGRISYSRAFARWLVATLFWVLLVIPGVLDGLSPLWRADRRAWHDRAVGSVVIRL